MLQACQPARQKATIAYLVEEDSVVTTCTIVRGPRRGNFGPGPGEPLKVSTALAIFTSLLIACRAAHALPPDYRVEDGRLILAGVSAYCPMIYDNDWWQDVPDAAYLWAKASQGKCDLRGNIITRCTFGWEIGYAHQFDEQVDDGHKLLRIARESGLRNVPDPVLGAKEALRRPTSGKKTRSFSRVQAAS
jgi:hypothetical protein